jgi:hypothetical protein
MLGEVKKEVINMEHRWKSIMDEMKRDDEGKVDYLVPINRLYMDENGLLLNSEVNEKFQIGRSKQGLIPNDWATGQLCSRIGMPGQYVKKCLDIKDDYLTNLTACQVNYWMEALANEQKDEGKPFLLRAKNDICRAVLSDRYSTLDNKYVVETVNDSLFSANESDSVKVKEYYLSDRSFHLRVIFPGMTMNMGTGKNPDPVTAGIHIINSEVGFSSLMVETLLYRQVCSNGLVVRVGGEIILSQRHIFLEPEEMQHRLVIAMNKAIDLADSTMITFKKAKTVPVKSPLDLIDKLAKDQKYSQEFTDNIKNSWNKEPQETVYAIVNALTDSAKVLPFDKRLEVETFAGDWMNKMVA